MKNLQGVMVLVALLGVSLASAYYDSNGVWHEGVVAGALDTITGGRYSDAPQDREARIKADRKLEDKQRDARRKYHDEQAKIQRKKEDRRSGY
ncbi:MAG TPA: hypothetical protein VKU36_02065 [Candidatus Babeliales bacterium]|jgi:hypothetical protein|nr:hypothetical protein [Candidatus Babeliales bacterium]